MNLPLQITFHNMEPSTLVEDRVQREALELDKFCDAITSCRVVVDMPHRHHQTGNAYQVRVDITVPGEELAATNEPAEHDPRYQDVNVAIRDAFDVAARELEDYVRRRRRQ